MIHLSMGSSWLEDEHEEMHYGLKRSAEAALTSTTKAWQVPKLSTVFVYSKQTCIAYWFIYKGFDGCIIINFDLSI